MKTTCEKPYQTAMSVAATLLHAPENVPLRHRAALAHQLAEAVMDLDARMRAGITPPQPWERHPHWPLDVAAPAHRFGTTA